MSVYFTFVFSFIDNENQQRKMLEELNIRCCSYEAKKQFDRMNVVLVLAVIVSAKRTARVDRVRLLFLSDGSL